uniref:Variant surface glycoprotein 1125.116 n=1 Tax=Trypanosoma brucei TaxID=5691 RepID=A0A1J0R589_9TRYP|nr:variant surface glycoprotein 1125.116 [Trypanosoma brucei]
MTLKQRLAAFSVVMVLFYVHPSAADTGKGTLRQEFGALCDLVNLALTTTIVLPSDQNPEAVVGVIPAINLTRGAAEFTSLLEKDKGIGELKKQTLVPQAGPELEKWQEHWDFWQLGLKKLEEQKTKAEYENWRQAHLTRRGQKQIEALAGQAFKLYKKYKLQKAKLDPATVNKAKQDALYGKDQTEAMETTADGDNRAAKCGKHGVLGTSLAGRSLRWDLHCLCAFANSDNDQGQACCPGCGATQDEHNLASDNWAGDKEHTKIWTVYKKECKKLPKGERLTASALSAAVGNFKAQLSKTKSNTDEATMHLLGTTGGEATDGCTSRKNGNGGKCVHYKGEHFSGDKITIPWSVSLEEALTQQEHIIAAAQSIRGINQQIDELNETPKDIIWDTEVKNHAKKAEQTAPRETDDLTKECEAITVAADCKTNGNCEWEGGDAKDGKNCTLNTAKVEQQATKAPGTGEGAAATTGCAKHGTNKDACLADKKDDKPVCAWRKGKDGEDDKETEKCRSSSFIVTKKFALSMVSAAFVALLF